MPTISLLPTTTACLVIVLGLVSRSAMGAPVDFESQVAPILVKRCLECHHGADPSGALNLATSTGLMAGGESGPAIEINDADSSLLIDYVAAGEMPPPEKGKPRKLADEEITILRGWIDGGAHWPNDRTLDLFEQTTELRAGRDWWSLQPLSHPQVPTPAPSAPTTGAPVNPIDAFIGHKLAEHHLTPAPPADRRTLIRRLYYDVLGLPPTREQIERFVNDPSADAWPRLVDHVLQQPQYGEQWARHWLDLARYADTSGYERDQEKPAAWKYRDWVTKALNEDMPYDQFVTAQIAGDEISNPTKASVIATGFLRLGTWNDEPNEPLDYQYDRLEDLVHTTASTFLGLTVKCARCHAHKFDPIRQEDYYRFASAFWTGPIAPRDRNLLGGPTAEELGFDDVLGWTDVADQPPPLHVLKNGERDKPLQAIVPGTPTFLPDLQWDYTPDNTHPRKSGRRLQLAHWITHPDNPLTPRVIVNRLWLHHFGQAIVRTPNNFGFLADPPTHPQLLDWLAGQLQTSGGSLKHIHRLILTSATWQQSSLHPEQTRLLEIDPTNRLVWKFPRRRLSAEAIRDTLLVISGQLDTTIGGPSFRPTLSAAALDGLSQKSAAWQASPTEQQHRRTLYCFMKRGLLPPLLTTFDLCDATQSCGQRESTTVPTQALALLNGQFIHERGLHLAEQIISRHHSPQAQITAAWSTILSRDPTANEMKLALQHLQQQQAAITRASETSTSSTTVSTGSVHTTPSSVVLPDLAAHFRFRSSPTDSAEFVPWIDAGPQEISAAPPTPTASPHQIPAAIGDQPGLYFDGQDDFLALSHPPLTSPHCTIVAVARNEPQQGHRELISNWRAGENVGSSLFLGLTADNTVRFSDAFADAGKIPEPTKPFILTAINSPNRTAVYCNGALLAELPHELPGRKLDTPWVIGQQGNIQGEFWHGLIAEIRIYANPLDEVQRQFVETELAAHYNIRLLQASSLQSTPPDPKTIPLASLCHVLLNSNELLYID